MHKSGGEPDRADRLKNSLPLKRGGQPEEVAAAISWLVSSESSYTTGSFIEVSGGSKCLTKTGRRDAYGVKGV